MQHNGAPPGDMIADGCLPLAEGTSRMAKTVTVKDDQSGKSWKFPVLEGTVGPDVVDFRKFYAETDMFTFDPGFTSTGS